MTTKEILQKARELLVTDGWCQHAYRRNDRHCTLDAIRTAINSENPSNGEHCQEFDAAVRPLLNALNYGLYADSGTLANWNDKENQTQEVVIATFDKAIASLP